MNYFLIGDLAKICDVNVKTIRFYEEKELLFLAYTDKWIGYSIIKIVLKDFLKL